VGRLAGVGHALAWVDAAQRAAPRCAALVLQGPFQVAATGPGAGQLPADAGGADHGQQPCASAGVVLGEAVPQVDGPAGVVAGVPVGTVEVQEIDGSAVGGADRLSDGGVEPDA